jgi:hypothetical protein
VAICKDQPALVAFLLLTLVGSILARLYAPRYNLFQTTLFAALIYGTTWKIASLIPDISAYPFSLGWSETSRYYYASLFLSNSIYGLRVPPSVLHPTRYLMQALAFLIPEAQLWQHRLWQVLLWSGFTFGAAITLLGRLRRSTKQTVNILEPLHGIGTIAFICWAFLFLWQGPVYYHLLVMVILTLWGADNQHPWRTLFIVIVCSIWAGISRVNWFPVPGILVSTLYLLETPVHSKPIWRYLLPPIFFVSLGTAIAYASQQLYIAWSGNPSEQFGSSFSSDLLWYRLFPNATYRLGILPSAILVSLPLLSLIYLRLRARRWGYHPIRLLGLGSILTILFTGGVVVSLKIGGGSNLHNLDAYLVLLLVTGTFIYFGALRDETNACDPPVQQYQPILAAAVALPVLLAVMSPAQIPQYDFEATGIEMDILRDETHQASKHGEVLFISQRHLLAFDEDFDDIALVPDCEKVF